MGVFMWDPDPSLRPAPPHSCHTTAQVLRRQGHTLTGHHGARLKAVSTGTFKASNDVGAGAFPTWVPSGTLVCI